MQRFLPSLLIGLVLSLPPATALAIAPPPVTGIEVKLVENRVVVSWDAPEDADIAFYRIYFSSKSILENDGFYDDSEETLGPSTERALQVHPTSPQLFVSVLSVNRAGEESEFFMEEAVVTLREEEEREEREEIPSSGDESEGREEIEEVKEVKEVKEVEEVEGTGEVKEEMDALQPQHVADASQPQPQQALPPPGENLSSTLHLLLVDVLSPTQLELTFSARPTVDPQRAPAAFSITDQFARPLPIRNIVIDGKIVTVTTAPQTPGTIYKLQLSEPLSASDGSPLDRLDRQSYFLGWELGVPQTADLQPYPPEGFENRTPPAAPIQRLRLRAQAVGRGVHNVSATWEVDPRSNLQAYIVRQSIDGGRMFSEPQVLQADIAGIEIPGVLSALYGLGMSTVAVDGRVSNEVFETLELPGGILPPRIPITEQQPQPTPPPNPNPNPNPNHESRITPVDLSLDSSPEASAKEKVRLGRTKAGTTNPRTSRPSTELRTPAQSKPNPKSTSLAQTGISASAVSLTIASAIIGLRQLRRRRDTASAQCTHT